MLRRAYIVMLCPHFIWIQSELGPTAGGYGKPNGKKLLLFTFPWVPNCARFQIGTQADVRPVGSADQVHLRCVSGCAREGRLPATVVGEG